MVVFRKLTVDNWFSFNILASFLYGTFTLLFLIDSIDIVSEEYMLKNKL